MVVRCVSGLQPSGDEGVSPVIGMILVLAISVAGIAAIMYWGLPTIEDMKANVEARSVQSQYLELISEIEELEAGSAGKTAKRWQPSLQRGFIVVDGTSERWAMSWDLRHSTTYGAGNRWNFTYGGFSDSDNTIYIKNMGASQLDGVLSLKAYRLDATLAREIVLVETIQNVPETNAQPSALSGPWDAGDIKTLYLREMGDGVSTQLDHDGFGLRVEIYEDGVLVSQLFVLDMGKVHFQLPTSGGERELLFTEGGLIQGTNGRYVFLNSPPIPPPKNTSGVYRMFARAIQIDGNVEVTGAERFDILVNLYGTSRLVDYPCTEVDNCVQMVRYYPMGDYGAVWRNYFTTESNGYGFVAYANDMASDDTDYVLDWKAQGISFQLLQSVVTITG